MRVLRKQRRRRNHLSGRADAALQTAARNEGVLDCGQFVRRRDSLDRLNARSLDGKSERQTRRYESPIDQHAAAAANADAAAFFGAGQAAFIAQDVE